MVKKKITIEDIATEAGVNKSTVSNAINNKSYVKKETKEMYIKNVIVDKSDITYGYTLEAVMNFMEDLVSTIIKKFLKGNFLLLKK